MAYRPLVSLNRRYLASSLCIGACLSEKVSATGAQLCNKIDLNTKQSLSFYIVLSLRVCNVTILVIKLTQSKVFIFWTSTVQFIGFSLSRHFTLLFTFLKERRLQFQLAEKYKGVIVFKKYFFASLFDFLKQGLFLLFLLLLLFFFGLAFLLLLGGSSSREACLHDWRRPPKVLGE